MRIIIAGGRDFNDYEMLARECNHIFINLAQEGCFPVDVNESRRFIEVISGTAKGTDKLGERFAQDYQLIVKRFPAEWDNLDVQPCKIKYNKYGKPYNALAGHNRNKLMAEYASKDNGILIAFHDGKSTGTQNMINLANEYGLRIFIVKY